MRVSLKLLAAVGLSVSVVTAISACSDTTIVAAPDGSLADTGLPDTSLPDVVTTTDASDAQVKPDVSDASIDTRDGDIPYTALQFKTAMVDTYCQRAQNTCCSGKPFNIATCRTILDVGVEGSTLQLGLPNVDQKNIEVDITRANACIDGVAAQTCVDKTANAAQIKAIAQDCFAAFKGKLNANDPCHQDIECKPGLYCEGGYDPGTGTYPPAGGTCKPLKQLGDDCHQTDASLADNCSTRGSGDSGRYCGPSGKCEALIANDQACFLNTQCASGSCDPASFSGGKVYCKSTFTDTQLCTYFTP